MGHVGGIEDEIKGESPVLVPVLFRGGDEVFGAEGEGVGFLVQGVRDDVDFGAEGGGEHDGEVAETAAGSKGERWVSVTVGLGVNGWDGIWGLTRRGWQFSCRGRCRSVREGCKLSGRRTSSERPRWWGFDPEWGR